MGYLTPDTLPTDTICRVLFIPNNEEFLANVTGALQTLTLPENWTKDGTLTPDEAAAAVVPMFDAFSFNQGTCRMIGEIITYIGTTVPDPRWLSCDGATHNKVDYPDLYAILPAPLILSATQFKTPILNSSRVPQGTTVAADIGKTGGTAAVTITAAQMPAHTHIDAGHTHAEGIAIPALGAAIVGVPVPSGIPGVGITGIGVAALGNAGGGATLNIVPAHVKVLFCIVALP